MVNTLEAMAGIDPRVSCYHLKVDPKHSTHRQKRIPLNSERYESLKAKVRKSISNGFNREAVYLKLISKPMLIKKHSEK